MQGVRRAAYFLGLIAMSTVCDGAAAADYNTRSVVRAANLFTESAVMMAAIAEAAAGNEAKGRCIADRYFGSPQLTRKSIEQFWGYPDREAQSVITILLNHLCSDGQTPPRTRADLWQHVNSDAVQIEELGDATVAMDAGIRVLFVRAKMLKDNNAATCIIEKYKDDKQLLVAARNLLSTEASGSISRAAYLAVQQACGYPNAKLPPAGKPVIPIVNYMAAARERLLAVKDLERCDRSADEAARKSCVELSAELRLFKIATAAALFENKQKLTQTGQEIEKMRESAWRLPDGRLLFEDKSGAWQFEDGSVVPPALANTKVPPSNRAR